jgi:hypothetical protein
VVQAAAGAEAQMRMVALGGEDGGMGVDEAVRAVGCPDECVDPGEQEVGTGAPGTGLDRPGVPAQLHGARPLRGERGADELARGEPGGGVVAALAQGREGDAGGEGTGEHDHGATVARGSRIVRGPQCASACSP